MVGHKEAIAYADWIRSLKNIKLAEPVSVEFNNQVFFGAFYGQVEEYYPIETAVRDGVVKAGEKHTVYRISLLGIAPKKMHGKPFNRQVFSYKHDKPTDDRAYRSDGLWYRICYYEKYQDDPWHREVHPHGNAFTLGEHRVHTFGYYKDQGIDHYEETPYCRNDMKVQWLSRTL